MIMALTGCGGGGGDAVPAGPTTLTPAEAARAGTFAGVDNPANPTTGALVTVTANAANTGFDVTGKAVSATGAAWTLAGTMTRAGVLQINATGVEEVNPPAPVVKPAAPANMTITGTMTATQTIPVTVNSAVPVQMTFEKAVALPAASPLVAKFTLAADPGVTNATQMQHAAASLTVKADGKISGALVHTGVTAIPADPLDPNAAPISGSRFAKCDGIVKSDGTFICVAGGNAASGLALISLEPLTYPSAPSGAIFTGTVAADGQTATLNVRTRPLGGILPIPQFAMTKALNPQAGVLAGTHDGDAGGPGPIILGVNDDGSAFGFMKFETPAAPNDPTPRPHAESHLVGTVGANGTLAPGTIPIPPSGAIVLNSGLVIVNDGDTTLLPSTLSGTVTAGQWQAAEEDPLAPGTFVLETTGAEFFTANLIP
jgi:hypothetical protein